MSVGWAGGYNPGMPVVDVTPWPLRDPDRGQRNLAALAAHLGAPYDEEIRPGRLLYAM